MGAGRFERGPKAKSPAVRGYTRCNPRPPCSRRKRTRTYGDAPSSSSAPRDPGRKTPHARGYTPQTTHTTAGQPKSPAHTGMHLGRGAVGLPGTGKPRTYGDQPTPVLVGNHPANLERTPEKAGRQSGSRADARSRQRRGEPENHRNQPTAEAGPQDGPKVAGTQPHSGNKPVQSTRCRAQSRTRSPESAGINRHRVSTGKKREAAEKVGNSGINRCWWYIETSSAGTGSQPSIRSGREPSSDRNAAGINRDELRRAGEKTRSTPGSGRTERSEPGSRRA